MCGLTPSNSTLEVPRTLGPIAARLLAAELRTFVFAEGVSASMGDARARTRERGTSVLNRRGAFAAADWQPLLWAAKENHAEMLGTLLDLGLDVNEQQPPTSTSAKLSALHVAAAKGNEGIVRLLLERGADPALRDKHNNTAIMLAEKKRFPGIVALLGTATPAASSASSTPMPTASSVPSSSSAATVTASVSSSSSRGPSPQTKRPPSPQVKRPQPTPPPPSVVSSQAAPPVGPQAEQSDAQHEAAEASSLTA